MVKKKRNKKTKKAKREHAEKVRVEMQPVLVDNFVALQKVMVNLASKFDNVNTQLTKLLDIFETSAKTLAKKGFKLEAGEEGANNDAVLEKLSELSEQNKVIARGMTLMHEAVTAPEPIMMPPAPMPAPAPMPTMMPPAPNPFQRLPKQGAPAAEGGYKKSAPMKEGKSPVKTQSNVPSPPPK